MSLSLRVHERIDEIPRASWDRLLDDAATPFLRWSFLEALERSGCAAPKKGWWPRHLSLWRDEHLVAAAPAYIRSDSEGDFSRDWGWAHSILQAGIRYYPKLILSVPFTPATGRRILVAPGEPREPAVAGIVAGALALAKEKRLSSVHVLFPTPTEAAELEAVGLTLRMDVQCHFFNRGFTDLTSWLASLDSKRRHQAKRERAAPAAQGITIRTVRGAEIAADPKLWADEVFGLYHSTITKLPWGRPWLNHALFTRLFAEMPESLEVVEARRDGRLIAGAWNVAGATRLYGRYWGCHEEIPFLHFNVCLYHSIEDCIARGLEVFEGGAGGEHKLSRGFVYSPTHSAHVFVDERLNDAMRRILHRERSIRMTELERWEERKKT